MCLQMMDLQNLIVPPSMEHDLYMHDQQLVISEFLSLSLIASTVREFQLNAVTTAKLTQFG